jgi:hypothetical protein
MGSISESELAAPELQITKELSVVLFEPGSFHNRRIVAAYLTKKPTEDDPTSEWVVGLARCSPGLPGRYGPDQFIRKKGIKIARKRAVRDFHQSPARVIVKHTAPFSWRQAIADLEDRLYVEGALREKDTFEDADEYKVRKLSHLFKGELTKFMNAIHSITDNRELDMETLEGVNWLDTCAIQLDTALDWDENEQFYEGME